MGDYNSFVVRVWTDEIDGRWRGHIQHVATRDEAYFVTRDKMEDFITGHLGYFFALSSEIEG